jgi:hypothetical protein
MSEPIRIPLIESIEARSASSDKDGMASNIFFDKDSKGTTFATKRPGISILQSGAGLGNGIFSYGINLFVFTDYYGTSYTLPSTLTMAACAYSGSIYVAIQHSSQYITSTDGVTWVVRTLPVNNTWQQIIWTGTQFVIVGSNFSGSSVCLTSPDGTTWTSRTIAASTHSFFDIAWNGSVFCIVDSGTANAYTSSDAITWTLRSLPSSADWTHICWGGGLFVTVANSTNKIATSPNGTTWTARTNASRSAYQFGGVVYGNSHYVIGPTGTGYDEKNTAVISTDGITWTNAVITVASNTYGWNRVAYDNVHIIIGGDNTVASTTNGTVWNVAGLNQVGASQVWNGYSQIGFGRNIAFYTSSGVSYAVFLSGSAPTVIPY